MAGNYSDTTTVAQHTIGAPGFPTAAVTADPEPTGEHLEPTGEHLEPTGEHRAVPGDAAPARGEGE